MACSTRPFFFQRIHGARQLHMMHGFCIQAIAREAQCIRQSLLMPELAEPPDSPENLGHAQFPGLGHCFWPSNCALRAMDQA